MPVDFLKNLNIVLLANIFDCMKEFEYGEMELNYLRSRDKTLGMVIDKIGYLPHYVDSNFFSVLVNNIIIQQISLKAADAIWHKLMNLLDGNVTPQNVVNAGFEKIKSVGISSRKVEYIIGVAEKILLKEIDVDRLQLMDDESISNELLKIRGVGNWTVEMLLIFCFSRKNILSYGDLTIIRGLKMLYDKKDIDKKFFEKCRKLYSPYCTIASFYLWYIAEGKMKKEDLEEVYRTNINNKNIENMAKYVKSYDTKIGKIFICSDDNSLTNIFFNGEKLPQNLKERETEVIKLAIKELIEYFDGKRKTFTVPLNPYGTDFQKKVWKALQAIPYGKTCSYKDIAEAVRCPKGCRAVGSANGKNPIPIIIPCHRVIKNDLTIGGYSAGLNIKRKLFDVENIRVK